MTMIEVEPQPRIDTVVRLPGGADARRTDYVGTAWFDGKPQVSGLTLQRSSERAAGVPFARHSRRRSSYRTACRMTVQRSATRYSQHFRWFCAPPVATRVPSSKTAATFVDRIRGTPTLDSTGFLQANIGWPEQASGYRIVALALPDADSIEAQTMHVDSSVRTLSTTLGSG